MRLGEQWGTWPFARLEFTPEEIRIDFFGQHAVTKWDVEKVIFLRGRFTCDVEIHHTCDWSDEPIRFFGFGRLPQLERVARDHGYPWEIRKKRFYEKGDITVVE